MLLIVFGQRAVQAGLIGSVFREDRRGWEAGFGVAAVADEFFAGKPDMGPVAVAGADADDPAGANAFGDEVGLKSDLDTAATQGHLSVCLCHLENRPRARPCVRDHSCRQRASGCSRLHSSWRRHPS